MNEEGSVLIRQTGILFPDLLYSLLIRRRLISMNEYFELEFTTKILCVSFCASKLMTTQKYKFSQVLSERNDDPAVKLYFLTKLFVLDKGIYKYYILLQFFLNCMQLVLR